jgi:hypothetical protein
MGTGACFPPGSSSRGVKLDHSSPSTGEIENVGVLPLLPAMPSWCDAELIKARDIFTFLTLFLCYSMLLEQRWPTGGPQLDLIRPPSSHRFGSIGEGFNICLILLVQRKI